MAINRDLTALALLAQQSPKLRTLRMRFRHPPSDGPRRSGDYLTFSTMQEFLSMENLSVLVLDTSVGFFASGEEKAGDHVCTAVNALLGSLRTLHVRMPSICPDILSLVDAKESLRLSTVAINLCSPLDVPGITSLSHSKRCGSQEGGVPQLKADLVVQAEALAARMSSPKTVRILTHLLLKFETQSFDVLTGKTMRLVDGAAWDEDGQIIEDSSDAESEIPDDESSSSFD
ncbi:hypothetical protein F4808DRAFT_426953, partial [Astrocystis sublimbata]